MKTKRLTSAFIGSVLLSFAVAASAQTIDEERMIRDIKVAENVLATMIRQKFDGSSMFFTLQITGSYQPGYGVTFTLPADYTTPIVFNYTFPRGADAVIFQDAQRVNSPNGPSTPQVREFNTDSREWRLKDRKQLNLDSIRDLSNEKLIEATKEFLADYGDLLSQVPPGERIVVTNRGTQPRLWVGQLIPAPNRAHISVELNRGSLNDYKEGKLSRDQLMKQIKVVNAVATDELEPDLELLSTIFSRLYRPDLSKTYFIEGNVHYEHLKDFGVIYYMQMFSANRTFTNSYDMPTLGLRDVNQAERDGQVKELYPRFEAELKENIIEYGRTIKSLRDDESLIFNVRLTRCDGCGIPASLELSVKGNQLRDYNSGKTSKQQILDQIQLKKGNSQ